MALSKEVLHNLLFFQYELGKNAKTAANQINQAKGRGTVSERTAQWWFAKFCNGDTELEDQPRTERPREIDREAVIEAIEEDPTLTTGDLANDFECSNEQIQKILKAAGKKWRKGNWVSHDLTQAQKNKKKQIAQKFICRQNQTPFLNQIVTIDKKWIFFKSQRRPNQ